MLNENLDTFLDLDHFAVTATLNRVAVKVIFDDTFAAFELGAEGRSITALGKSSDLINVSHGDEIRINQVDYSVVGVQPQGDGAFTLLILKR
ncbi:head-tail joining protein [Microcystis aeruginosa]|uniref:head-tail joining protein n=1 Tax=Microcystis aeruginosa TaxID=1126 RepID=UPI0007764CB2|nr:hypothetical protein [Microcystis aeruginosa]KXS91922.1 hypothetical protein OA58_08920 [Microcystis aeruginosa NIES-88]